MNSPAHVFPSVRSSGAIPELRGAAVDEVTVIWGLDDSERGDAQAKRYLIVGTGSAPPAVGVAA